MKEHRRIAFYRWAKWGVAVILFSIILLHIDFASFLHTVRDARLLYLVPPCAIYLLGVILASMKLKLILEGFGMPITFGSAFYANWTATFFNNFLPSTVGGDIYRVIHVGQAYRTRTAQVVSAVILDRGLGLLATVMLAAIASIPFIGSLIHEARLIALIYGLAAVVMCAGFFIFFGRHGLRFSPGANSGKWSKVSNGLNVLLSYPNKKVLALSLLVSFVSVALTIFFNYCLFLAFRADISIWVLSFLVPILALAAMIPVSINALGVTEGLGIVLFSKFGFEPELVLSILLAGRVLQVLCSLTGGIPLIGSRKPSPQVE
jgi:uncharacterized membrane protein YbhN (UPF0104 family)